jgi:hypothetical protein
MGKTLFRYRARQRDCRSARTASSTISSITLAQVSALIHLDFAFNLPPQEHDIVEPPTPCTCPDLEGHLLYRATILPSPTASQDTG